MVVERKYHGWEEPFTSRFAEDLKRGAEAGVPLDSCLIWVPSARAGRHILNQLFTRSGEEVEAFHPPRLTTPAQFISAMKGGLPSVASELQCLHAWKQVLDAAHRAELAPVFPEVVDSQRQTWAFAAARQLMALRARLAEDRRTFRGIAQADLPHDHDRWEVLALLEGRYLSRLQGKGLVDPDSALAEKFAAEATPEDSWSRILLAGILNLTRRQEAWLEAQSVSGKPVILHLPFPPEEGETLDAWGRPLSDPWARRPLPEDLLEGRVQRARDPRELTDSVFTLGRAYGKAVDALVVGSGDPATTDYLVERSRLDQPPFYDPRGKPLSETAWGRLLFLLSEWQQGGRVRTLFDLLGDASFGAWLRKSGLQVKRLQAALLRLEKNRFLKMREDLFDAALEETRDLAEVRSLVHILEAEGLGSLDPGKLPDGLWKILRALAGKENLHEEDASVIGCMRECLQELKADFAGPDAVSAADTWDLLRHALENSFHYPEREAAERPVSGWLELPWETAPHLVLLGLPDSQVPGPRSVDSFLTPALCRSAGLYGPDEAEAADAARLRILLESRRSGGRLDLLLPDRGLDDSPILPSRFLFPAAEEELTARVRLLLGERPTGQSPLAPDPGNRLRLDLPQEERNRLSVTAFKAYLANPFHFMLERLLRWEAPEPLPRELDALAYGELAHDVLLLLNSDPEAVNLIGEKEIQEFLDTRLAERALRIYGNAPGVALRIQLDSLRERLKAAAAVIAAERRKGWLPFLAEWKIEEGSDLLIGDFRLTGRIDLVERNEENGLYRIIDYKTSDKAESPVKTHLAKPNARSGEPLFPEMDFVSGDKRLRWKDLQLPLYLEAFSRGMGEPASCAYFNLPKAISETGVADWTPGPKQREAALSCAHAVARLVASGHFPLPDKAQPNDPWLVWFGGDYTAALPECFQRREGEGKS